MTVSPPGHWILNRMVYLLHKTLGIINTTVEKGIVFLLQNSNTFTGINTFTGGINVNNINSINGNINGNIKGNITFNSEIIVNSNITANNGSFTGNNLVINNIEKNTNSNVTFKNNINMNNNNINNVDTIFSNTLNINTISLEDSSLPYITVNDDITFIKDINVNGNLIVDGSTFTVNRETLTINDRFIVLNANLSGSGLSYTDPAGIIVDTHDNNDNQNRGYLLWTLFDKNDPTNRELNRTWDLSGDNLRGNVLKATTLRGNILDSYYSSNISVIKDINMNNNNIYDVDTIFGNTLNINQIKTNPAANISVLNTIDMNHNYIINANISALNHTQISVENGLINTQRLTLSNTNDFLTNDFNLGATHGMNIIEPTKLNIWKRSTDISYTLFLPENNGQTKREFDSIIGGESPTNTSSILAIGAFYKSHDSLQSLNNSQCYLIPPSMIPSNITELQGQTLFETIGETNQRIRHLAGYNLSNNSINHLSNTLVPTVGQIVDLLTYLDVSMNGKQTNLASFYS